MKSASTKTESSASPGVTKPHLLFHSGVFHQLVDGRDQFCAHIHSELNNVYTWKEVCETRTEALLRIRKAAYDNLWFHIEKHILHSYMVMQHSNTYRDMAILEAIDQCTRFNEWIPENKYRLDLILNKLLAMHRFLHAILPHPGNNSYANSLARLESLQITANEMALWMQQNPL